MSLRAVRGFRFVQVRQGDTLQDIAARELGDATRWPDLVALNKLSPPYLTGDPLRAVTGVKLYGATIIVPSAKPMAVASVDPDLVFGVDVALTNGQLSAGANGDLATVGGRANLKQALLNRLATPLKELLFHLRYGNGAFRIKGRVNGPTAASLGGRYVRDALSADDRVAAVNAVDPTVAGDVLSVVATVTPIAGAPVALSLPQA